MYKNIINKVGVFSLSLFVAATAAYVCLPVIRSNAEENATVNVNTTVNPVASLTLDTSSLSFEIIPTAAGVFESKPITATVDTNASGGYELYLSSIDESTDMTSTNTDVIASDFSGTVTSSTMANNKWGYSLDDTDFSKIPALSNQATIRNINHFPTTAERSTAVYFGTKISSTLTSGRYSKTVLFSVVAHPDVIVDDNCDNIYCIEEMQKMTPEICANTTTPLPTAREVTFEKTDDNTKIPRTVMRDNRDNKLYLVSKFADGKCWMSQNLELELSTDVTLTSENTDLNSVSSWTPAYDTFDNYLDLEAYGVPNPRDWTFAVSAKPSTKYLRGADGAAETPSTDDGKSEWQKVGIYYNWVAATASSIGPDIENFNPADPGAKDSICPKGWRLPIQRTHATTDDIDGTQLVTASGGNIEPFTEAFAFIPSGTLGVTGPYSGDRPYRASFSNVGTRGVYIKNHAQIYYTSGSAIQVYNNSIRGGLANYIDLAQIRCIAREE